MGKKLQVFISSTFIDLKKERQKCVEAVLNAGHIPAGMELFKAGDKNQKQTIEDWIKDSDVYMLILGGRYGSIDPDLQISYTQWEYELAGKLGIPRFSIVLEDDYIEESVKNGNLKATSLEMKNPQYLDFKHQVMSLMVCKVRNLESIKGEVFGSLSNIEKNNPNLNGWVKSNTINKKEKEYMISISSIKSKLDTDYDKAINKLHELNKYLYPSSKNEAVRPVLINEDYFQITISIIIKAPSLYFAERRRTQFEEIVKDYEWFRCCDIEEFMGFKNYDTKNLSGNMEL